MPIAKSLHENSIRLSLSAPSADAVLREIAELAVKNPFASDLTAEAVYRALAEREQLGSTGLGHGIAIPHCTLDGIGEFIVGLVTLDEPIDFRSIDGTPTDLFFFIVGPRGQRNNHIKLLSAISKVASQSAVAEGLRRVDDRVAARELLLANLAYDEELLSKERVLFQIFVQNLDYFEEILNLLSSVVPGSISVVETRNAGAYLFSMPLFAAFWTEKSAQDGRMILALAEKQTTNSLIRQIQEITGDPDAQTGVVVTVQDLTYAAGSLSF
ncbi:MAG: PTS sugar transporter subunit IIA [Spirochaetota bacterium]